MPWSSHHGLAEEPPGSVLDPKQNGNWQARLLLVPEVVCVPCAKMKPRPWERGPCASVTLVWFWIAKSVKLTVMRNGAQWGTHRRCSTMLDGKGVAACHISPAAFGRPDRRSFGDFPA